MTVFYRTGLSLVDKSTEPALPDDVGFSVVVYGRDFAIVESDNFASDLPLEVEPIMKCLAKLLHSREWSSLNSVVRICGEPILVCFSFYANIEL